MSIKITAIGAGSIGFTRKLMGDILTGRNWRIPNSHSPISHNKISTWSHNFVSVISRVMECPLLLSQQ